MWVFLNDAFISVVQHRDKPDSLMVRARFRGDLEKVFPDRIAGVTETPMADYRYRLTVSQNEMRAAMERELRRVDYPNFKNSVQETWRHDAYMAVWQTMWTEQNTQARKLKFKPKAKTPAT